MARIFQENFVGFTAAGFAPTPAAGQLDSDVWRVGGLSDSANPAYGFTATTGDFARGTIAANDPTTAGVYAPTTGSGPALVVQPSGAEFESNGFIEARIANTTGNAITGYTIDFDWIARNSGDRASNMTFSYSTDGVNFTPVSAAAFASPATLAAGSDFTAAGVSPIELTDLSVAAGGNLFLRWTHTGSTGSGSRDEVGIDNLTVDTIDPIDPDAPPVYSIAVSPASVPEGDTGVGAVLTYTVTRAGDASQAGSVAVSLSGEATEGADYTVAGLTEGRISFAADATSATFTVTTMPDVTVEPNETVVATISAPQGAADASIGTATATGTILNDEFVITPISQVQGAGAASPLLGQTVTVEAIVVGDFQTGDEAPSVGGPNGPNQFEARDQNGFYLQQVDVDGNPLTSEGIFISEGTGDFADVAIGDRVRVTGVVQESFTTTQIAASAVTKTQAAALTLSEVDALAVMIDLPASGVIDLGANGYAADLEQYEGMLVRLPETLTITEQFNLDRFNEIRLFAADGFEQVGADGQTISGERPFTFSQHNTPDVAEFDAYQRQVAAREIVYDDGLGVQNASIDNLFPGYDTSTAPRMGDTITNLTGVARFDFNEWRVLKVANDDNVFTRENGNPAPETITSSDAGLKVASFNVLNYFTTLSGNIDNGQGARGANNQLEYQRQLDKLVVAIEALDSDIVGLIEIENDFSFTGDAPAVATLVDALNDAAGADVWAYADPGTATIGSDAIAVASIYRTDTVRIADGTGFDGKAIATLNTAGIFDATGGNRVPLAVTYQGIDADGLDEGEALTVVVNHFKSKGSASEGAGNADADDGAGASNATRLNAAEALDAWLDTNPTGSTTTNKVILGDLNSYASEDPIQHLLNSGYVNLAAEFLTNPYGYIFDGLVGTLDYILASGDMFDDVASLVDKIEDFTIGNINADEADALDYNTDFGRDPTYFDGTSFARASDHDPLVATFNLGANQQPGNYTLQILHFSDAEASTLAPTTAPFLAALVEAFEADYANTLILSGGDNFIAGPFLSAGADPRLDAVIGKTAGGRPDIAIHNEIGVELSTVGNHEFDFGPDFFDSAISADGAWSGALFPYLSANLDFTGTSLQDNYVDTLSGPVVPLASSFAPGAIVPATVIEEGGQRIGFVGATTQVLERIASAGGVEVEGFPKAGEPGDGTTEVDDMEALAAYLQPIIDGMIDQGINKIVLTSHLQDLANEQELATLLTGVDIILGAGSNTRLGDVNDVPRPGEAFQGNYPLTATDASGGTTLIVNTDGQYKYLGRLAIEFDAEGRVVTESLDSSVNGAYASTAENVAAAWNTTVDTLDATAFAEGTKGAAVREITDAVKAVMDEINATVIGHTDVALNGARNPGVRSEETNLGNITADANIAAARSALTANDEDARFVVGIKNGGGIRAGIDAGPITQGEVNAALAFDNRVMVFDTTAQGLLNILDGAAGIANNNGAFVQMGGMRYSYDEGAASGERVKSVALIADDGTIVPIVENGMVLANAPGVIKVSILNFVAQGGELPVFKANGENFRYVLNNGELSETVPETADFTNGSTLPDQSILERSLGEQQAFSDYIKANFGTPATAYDEADTAEAQDTRIQNLDLRDADTVFEGADREAPTFVSSTPADEAASVAAGADIVLTFSEDVQAGTGTIVITNDADPADIRTIDVADATQVTFDGATVTIDPAANLLAGGSYTVTFAAGTIEDLAGNDAVAFGNTALNFTVASAPVTPPPGGGGGTPPVSTMPTAGPDLISGVPGQDNVISAGAGADTVNAGAGNDSVFGNQDNDQLFGNQGNDTVFGGQGGDSVYGGQGNDAAYGNLGNDIVYGNLGDDQVFGNEGDDQVFGNEGNDLVHGGQGNDSVYGGQGNDVLNGGAGNDLLQGGFGSDVFVFDRAQGADVVADFRFGEGDRIDLRGQDYVLGQNNEGQATLFLEDGGTV
ncbi:MAG: ExeM/NucH family extracellular endonuclease, partial [Methylobacterium sp.]